MPLLTTMLGSLSLAKDLSRVTGRAEETMSFFMAAVLVVRLDPMPR